VAYSFFFLHILFAIIGHLLYGEFAGFSIFLDNKFGCGWLNGEFSRGHRNGLLLVLHQIYEFFTFLSGKKSTERDILEYLTLPS